VLDPNVTGLCNSMFSKLLPSSRRPRIGRANAQSPLGTLSVKR
jgi:hypothetical protein